MFTIKTPAGRFTLDPNDAHRQTLRLPDGRTLDVFTYAAPAGPPTISPAAQAKLDDIAARILRQHQAQ